jgi:DnaK suppressor protein
MRPKQLAAIRADLERLRDERLEAGPIPIVPNRTDDVSVGVADEDAQALSEMLQALSSQRNKQMAAEVALIHRALKKLVERPEEFGLCEDCEEEIPGKRLDSMPFAQFCAECQTKRDPRRGTSRKSITDYR